MSPRVAVLLAAVLFGTTGTAQALGPDGLEPTAVGAARILVGGLALTAIAGGLRSPVALGRSGRWVVLVNGLSCAAYQLAFFTAVQRTGVALGTVVAIGSAPAFTGLFGLLLRGERLTGRWAACTALAVAGVAVMALSGGSGDADPLGILLALGGGAGYGAYTVMGKGLLDAGHPPATVMAWTFGLGGLVLLPVLVLGANAALVRPGGLAVIAYLGVVTTGIAYVLFARGLKGLTAGETATLTLAEPLTATALGIVVLGESPTVLTALGAALVLAGLVVLAAGARHDRDGDREVVAVAGEAGPAAVGT